MPIGASFEVDKQNFARIEPSLEKAEEAAKDIARGARGGVAIYKLSDTAVSLVRHHFEIDRASD